MPGANITIIADDCSELAWTSYFVDCCQTYNLPIIPVSTVSKIAAVMPGWLRQQLVKMHIDLYVGFDDLFLVDGDTIFYDYIPYMVVPFQSIDLMEVDLHQSEYVSLTLKRPFKRFTHEGREGIVNFPGFRETNVVWWKELRRFIEKNHYQSVIDYHAQYKPLNGVSEWELLEQFKSQILKIPANLQVFSNAELSEETMPTNIHFATSWNSDKYYSTSWWQKQGIELAAWDKLPVKKGIWTK